MKIKRQAFKNLNMSDEDIKKRHDLLNRFIKLWDRMENLMGCKIPYSKIKEITNEMELLEFESVGRDKIFDPNVIYSPTENYNREYTPTI